MDSIFKIFIVTTLGILFALLFTKCVNLENENKRVKQQLIQDKNGQAVLNSHIFSCPVEFTMTNFEQHKSDHDNWCSPPFYTHPEGYKMCLKVYASGNGVGNGSYVSVFVSIMKGEFDNKLKWPFRRNFTISLLDQEDKNSHDMGQTVHFTDTVPVEFSSRSIDKESNKGWGLPKFIPHADLQSKNDCLKLRIQLQKKQS